MLVYYRYIYIYAFFHVFVCSLLLSYMLEGYWVARGSEDVIQYNH